MPPADDRRWIAALLVVVALFCAPMFAEPLGFLSGDAYRDNDWLTDRFFDLAARDAILEHGVLPLRSELVGGGYPTIGHPFDGSWAPTLLAVLAFGPVVGVKVNLVLLLLIGALGTYALGRRWLELPAPAAAFGAAAFALAGWLPSMMLVGFWPQALYMVVPATLALLLADRPEARIGAGALLFLLLQQAGNGFLAVLGFLALVAWTRGAWRARSVVPALWLILGTGSLAIARRYGVPTVALAGLAGCALIAGRAPAMHRFARAVRQPLARLAAAVLVAGTLGIGKIVAMAPVLAQAEYAHADNVAPSAWPLPGADGGPARVLGPDEADEHFFDGPGALLRGLLQRAPRAGTYVDAPGPGVGSVPLDDVDLRHASGEYIYVGLGLPVLLLALLGAAVGRERWWVVTALFAGSVAVCLGPHLLPDLHFLLAGGLPGFSGISQPIKYYSFFVLLPAALLAGRGALALAHTGPRWLTVGALGGCLAFTAGLNAPTWADRFAEPLPAWSCDDCRQVRQVGHRDWVGWPTERIERLSDALFLRERRRPPAAREYDNAAHGVGTIDWYGTLRLPEPAVPSDYVTPAGLVLPNPAYRGEAWLEGGRGAVRSVEFTPHRVVVDVDLDAPARLVVNQAWLPGFTSPDGTAGAHEGLLAIDLGPGTRTVSFRYRPLGTIAGLIGSAAFTIFWGVTFLVLSRRRE